MTRRLKAGFNYDFPDQQIGRLKEFLGFLNTDGLNIMSWCLPDDGLQPAIELCPAHSHDFTQVVRIKSFILNISKNKIPDFL